MIIFNWKLCKSAFPFHHLVYFSLYGCIDLGAYIVITTTNEKPFRSRVIWNEFFPSTLFAFRSIHHPSVHSQSHGFKNPSRPKRHRRTVSNNEFRALCLRLGSDEKDLRSWKEFINSKNELFFRPKSSSAPGIAAEHFVRSVYVDDTARIENKI